MNYKTWLDGSVPKTLHNCSTYFDSISADQHLRASQNIISDILQKNVKIPANSFRAVLTLKYLLQAIVRFGITSVQTNQTFLDEAIENAFKMKVYVPLSPDDRPDNLIDSVIEVNESVELDASQTMSNPNSSLHKAKALYNSLASKNYNRKDIIEEFVNQLGLSNGTATSYYYLAKKG